MEEGSNKVGAWIGAALSVIYLISPIDFVPDIVPIAGQLDDILIAVTGITNLIQKYLEDSNVFLARIVGTFKWIGIVLSVLVVLVGALIALLIYKAF